MDHGSMQKVQQLDTAQDYRHLEHLVETGHWNSLWRGDGCGVLSLVGALVWVGWYQKGHQRTPTLLRHQCLKA
ncbi:Os04g0202200 [Oryza sativa Japonica Group]|uniref:Os04g0202200 protein n=1 Tax=Oryza sativa subsp. japonica TaxID=39947 RepID=A0A0P0W7D6_ORYSJ|nr:Os04g0202200 [Oryza sativa Japonica Group]